MKKLHLIFGSLVVISLAALVAAWAWDSDGGFNIWQQGTCMDYAGNHTDVCMPFSPKGHSDLKEWYPLNDTCVSQVVNCASYNATVCYAGECA
jgi:hypothetical protein